MVLVDIAVYHLDVETHTFEAMSVPSMQRHVTSFEISKTDPNDLENSHEQPEALEQDSDDQVSRICFLEIVDVILDSAELVVTFGKRLEVLVGA